MWLWASAGACGLLTGVLIFSAICMFADLLWVLDLAPVTSSGAPADGFMYAMLSAALALLLTSWAFSTPLLVAFMKKRNREGALCRIAATLFLGSTIELLAAIPLLQLIARRDSCYCAALTSFAAFLALMAGFIVFGPMILLVLWSRRSRAGNHGYCAACGYDIRSLANRDRCPQCGAGWQTL